jgi:hypothetical protein
MLERQRFEKTRKGETAMNESTNRQTAQIIPFPVRHRSFGAAPEAGDISPESACKIVITESWYHQAAIEDEKHASRH